MNLTASQLSTFLEIAAGNGDYYATRQSDRHALYRCRLITKDKDNRVLTERGKVFLQMMQDTPLPVETTPKWVDPREQSRG